MNQSETITKIAAALVSAQKVMGDASKGAKNPFFKSMYADLNSIREAAIPVLNKYGVGVFQPTMVTLDGKNYVETLLLHESGEWMASKTEIKNVKGDPQGEGSGISYARRYGLQSFLNIGAVDDDGEAAQGRTNEGKVSAPSSKVVSFTGGVSTESAAVKQTTAANTGASRAGGVAGAKPVKETVITAAKLLDAQKKITLDAFKVKYQKNVGISSLTEDQLTGILNAVKKDYPHLNLGSN